MDLLRITENGKILGNEKIQGNGVLVIGESKLFDTIKSVLIMAFPHPQVYRNDDLVPKSTIFPLGLEISFLHTY